MDLIESGSELPLDLTGQIIYYAGPTPAKPGKVIGSAGPTTSGRMDPFTPLLIEKGLKGMVGKGIRGQSVIDAMKKFDSDKGVKFKTYAETRIRGAILDGIRSTDWIPRSVRRKRRELEALMQEIEQ